MFLFENQHRYFQLDPAKIQKSNPDALTRIIANHPALSKLTAATSYYLPYVTDAQKIAYAKEKKRTGYIQPLELVEEYFLKAVPIVEDIVEDKLFNISEENITITNMGNRIYRRGEKTNVGKRTKDYNLNRVALLVNYQNFLNGHTGLPENRKVAIHSPVLKGHFTELFVRLYYSYRLPRDNEFFQQNQAEIFNVISKKIIKGHFVSSNFQIQDGRRQYNNRQFKEILLLFVFATFNLAKNLNFKSEEISMSPSMGERDFLMVIGENYKKVLADSEESRSDWGEKYISSIEAFITKLGLSGYHSKTIRALENDALYHGGEMQEKEEFVVKKPNVESFFRQCARIAELYEDEEMENILKQEVKEEIRKLHDTIAGKKIKKYLDKLKTEQDNYRKIFIVSIIMQTYKKFANEFIKEVTDLKFKNFIYNEKKILLAAFKEDIVWDIFIATNNTKDFVDYIKKFLNENLRELFEEDEEVTEQELLEIKINSQKELAELFGKDIVQVIPDLFGNISIDRFPKDFVEAFKSLLMYQFETSTGEKINVPIPDLSSDESSFLFSSMGVDIFDNVEKTFDELLSGIRDFAEDAMERPKRTYVNYNSNEEYQHYNYKLQLLIKYIEAREPSNRSLGAGRAVLANLYRINDYVSRKQYFTENAKYNINKIYNQLFQGKKAFETITNFEKAMASVDLEDEKNPEDFLSQLLPSKKKKARDQHERPIELASESFEQNLQNISNILARGEMPEDAQQFATQLEHFAEHFFKAVLNAQNAKDAEKEEIFGQIVEKIMGIIQGTFGESRETSMNASNILGNIIQKISEPKLVRGCGIFAYVLSSSLSGEFKIPSNVSTTLKSKTSESFVKALQKFVDDGSVELELSSKDKSYIDSIGIPEEIPEAPEEIPEAPEAPEEIPEAPEEIPEAPEEIPEAPEEIPNPVLDKKPKGRKKKVATSPTPAEVPEVSEEIPKRRSIKSSLKKFAEPTTSSDEEDLEKDASSTPETVDSEDERANDSSYQDFIDSEVFESFRNKIENIEFDDDYIANMESIKEEVMEAINQMSFNETQKENILYLLNLQE